MRRSHRACSSACSNSNNCPLPASQLQDNTLLCATQALDSRGGRSGVGTTLVAESWPTCETSIFNGRACACQALGSGLYVPSLRRTLASNR